MDSLFGGEGQMDGFEQGFGAALGAAHGAGIMSDEQRDAASNMLFQPQQSGPGSPIMQQEINNELELQLPSSAPRASREDPSRVLQRLGITGPEARNIINSFKQYDADNSGFLEQGEAFGALMNYMPSASPSDIAQAMKRFDVNNDGKISLEEFVALARNAEEEEECSIEREREEIREREERSRSRGRARRGGGGGGRSRLADASSPGEHLGSNATMSLQEAQSIQHSLDAAVSNWASIEEVEELLEMAKKAEPAMMIDRNLASGFSMSVRQAERYIEDGGPDQEAQDEGGELGYTPFGAPGGPMPMAGGPGPMFGGPGPMAGGPGPMFGGPGPMAGGPGPMFGGPGPMAGGPGQWNDEE